MALVRPAHVGEVGAAVEVWELANAARRLPSHADRLRSWQQHPGAVLFVADELGELVGTTLSLLGRSDDGTGEVVPGLRHLSGVCVRPDRQGRGLGGRLPDAVLDHAREEGCDRVTLWTAPTNHRASRLFGSRGLHATGRTMPDELGAPMDHLAASLAATADLSSTPRPLLSLHHVVPESPLLVDSNQSGPSRTPRSGDCAAEGARPSMAGSAASPGGSHATNRVHRRRRRVGGA